LKPFTPKRQWNFPAQSENSADTICLGRKSLS
jgi:hypothetical protein